MLSCIALEGVSADPQQHLPNNNLQKMSLKVYKTPLHMPPTPPHPGTKINWTASLKPPPQLRAEWASAPHGLTHLGPDSPAFDAALDTVCSKLGVSTGTVRSTANAKLEDGLTRLGLDVEEYPRNCLSKTCSAYCNLGCRSGHKQSSEVWLQDAVRAGAHILTGVRAQQVMSTPQQVSVWGCVGVWVC